MRRNRWASGFVGLGNAASRVRSIPARSIATIGRGAALAASVLRYSLIDTITLRLPVGESVVQAWLLLTVTAIPAVLMAIPSGAMVSVVSSGLVNHMGEFPSGRGKWRRGCSPGCADHHCGVLLGGAAAAAIASDFGARAIREELDALGDGC